MKTAILFLALTVIFAGSVFGQNVRMSNDVAGGYTSMYTLATGIPYTDAVIAECSIARGIGGLTS